EEIVELAARVPGPIHRRRAAEQALQLPASLRLLPGPRLGGPERLAAEIEVLAEIALLLLDHRIGHRLGAGILVVRIVVPAVAAAAQVVAAGFALRLTA